MKTSEIASATKMKMKVVESIKDFEEKTQEMIRGEFEREIFFRPDSNLWKQKGVIFYSSKTRLDPSKDAAFMKEIDKVVSNWNKNCASICSVSIEAITPEMVESLSWDQSRFAPFYRESRAKYLSETKKEN